MERKQYPYCEIGKRLEDLMYDHNISDRALAERIGKKRKSILSYRHNESEMGIVTLMKICSVLGTTPNYLLYGKE
jgi:transcriptional regulator with XRE-family HTH domain